MIIYIRRPRKVCDLSCTQWAPAFVDSSQVFHFKWHMGHYGAWSPKPQRGWTNNQSFAELNRGPFRRSKEPKPKVKTVKKTISKATGKVQYTGTKELKSTQSGAYLFEKHITELNPNVAIWLNLCCMNLHVWTFGVHHLLGLGKNNLFTKGLSGGICREDQILVSKVGGGGHRQTQRWWCSARCWGNLWKHALVYLAWGPIGACPTVLERKFFFKCTPILEKRFPYSFWSFAQVRTATCWKGVMAHTRSHLYTHPCLVGNLPCIF